ncbi:MAG: hypothetical protein BroJett040_03680 [Oligoflexia bacterium]|nr:MAG: hypothetical protein BroJett040_03680 [Oligoflexia bacterium]
MSQNDMKILGLIFMLSVLILANQASAAVYSRNPAAINRAAQVLARPSQIFDSGILLSSELIQTYNEVKEKEKAETYVEIIPENIQEMNESNQVVAAIADRGLSKWWNSEAVQSSSFGRRAEMVEKKMQGEVVVHSAIEHKLNFQFQAFQTRAKIDYSGLTHATLYYQARNSEVGVEVTEKIADSQDLILSHAIKSENQVSQVNLRWSW